MQKIILCLLTALVLFQCRENNLLPASQNAATTTSTLGTYYVSTSGSDSNDGSSDRPWRTLRFAVTQVPYGYTIQVASGTYIEYGQVAVPSGVSIIGAGISQTILKIASPFYYHPASPGYAADKFMVNLTSDAMSAGDQTISNFSIDGDSKQLHGGIFVRNRSNVTVANVKVINTNFTGVWLWSLQDSRFLDSQLLNCAWGNSDYVVGALNIGDLTRVEIAGVTIDENNGYGIKAMGPPGTNNLTSIKVHDCRISVAPLNLWQNSSVPNFAIELWACNLVTNEFYNNYIDNTFSMVNENNIASTGIQTVRIHHNIFDLGARAQGATYAVELYFDDVEFDHNYFIKGNYGIVNWHGYSKNWSIHHNTFYALQGEDPGECVRAQSSGLHNVVFYNNTVEFESSKTMNVIGIYGGSSDNVDIKNNLFINNSGPVNHYQNEMLRIQNGAQLTGLQVRNNSFWKMAVGDVAGTYYGNITSDPQVSYSGARPDSYYLLSSSSPLIDAGLTTGDLFSGAAPDIGAHEFSGAAATSMNPTSSMAPIFIDSQSASLGGRMTTGSDGEAKNQSFFYVPASFGYNSYTPPTSAASFNVDISSSGDYIVWARVRATNGAQMLNIYNGAGRWFPWQSGAGATWAWTKITDGGSTALFPFVGGTNNIRIGWIDGGVQVDEIVVTQDAGYVPSGVN